MFSHPLDEGLTVIAVKFTRTSSIPAMFLVRLLAAFSCILWHSATTAFTLWCSTSQFVMNGSVSTTNRGSNAAKRIALLMKSLNHATLIQREMVTQFTTSLDCVKIGLIHSDYSFVCDVSQNHFNTGSHYGFLFFD